MLELSATPRWLGATPAFSLALRTWTQDLRTRYGLLAANHKRARLDAARTALQPPEPQALAIETAEALLVRVSGHDPCRCPHCASGR
ncbi:MAG: hypothetical protein ACK4KV_20595 [Rhodocyclaceae bacterium]